MPISRSNRTYYTKEEYEAAKRNDNALFYAQRQGYDLVRTGRYFYMRQHDSLVFAPSGCWFWNSRGLSGRALEFIVLYEGRSFPEAVLILARTVQPGFTPRVIPRSIPPPGNRLRLLDRRWIYSACNSPEHSTSCQAAAADSLCASQACKQ